MKKRTCRRPTPSSGPVGEAARRDHRPGRGGDVLRGRSRGPLHRRDANDHGAGGVARELRAQVRRVVAGMYHAPWSSRPNPWRFTWDI